VQVKEMSIDRERPNKTKNGNHGSNSSDSDVIWFKEGLDRNREKSKKNLLAKTKQNKTTKAHFVYSLNLVDL
jgi:hypothetical protein